MTAGAVKGVEALRRRFAAASAPQPIKAALQREANAIAQEARRSVPVDLGRTVEVIDDSRGTRSAYAIGTADSAGRFLEFGTMRRPATPWLWPIFRARSAGVKVKLGKLVAAAFKNFRAAV